MKSFIYALALAPVLAVPALAEPMSCVTGDQFVACPPGQAVATPNGGAMVTGPIGLVGGVVGSALAVPGAVLGTTGRILDPEATGSIGAAPRTAYPQAATPMGAASDDDAF